MRGLPFVLMSVALTFLSWGVYGPVLHEGQGWMDHSRLRPFICVGMAYFVVAVVVPVVWLKIREETGHWTMTGTIWSLSAGAAGAVGALGIILAFGFGGSPVSVMPLVFGCAPVVNTFVTMAMARSFREAGFFFFLGVLAVAMGAAGVMLFKPGAGVPNLLELPVQQAAGVLASIALTAACWGAYGPVLHKGQMKMAGSRLRPFVCVGLAYFAIAVVVPVAVLAIVGESGGWSIPGTMWALAAGTAGAVGALGIILAFNFGGKPIYVMPLVFGGAPVVNTFTSIITKEAYRDIPVMFFVSLGLVIVGAVTVLIFAPKPGKKPAAASEKPSEPVEDDAPSALDEPAEKKPE